MHNGRGTPEHFGVEDEVDLHGGTFAKSFGTFGGYICGSKRALDFIKFVSPGFMLTKALPGCITAATIKSLELMQSMPERRHSALGKHRYAPQTDCAMPASILVIPKGAVTSIFTRGAMALSAVRMLMEEHKILVNPVMYPAVPYGTSIIRMTASALHSPEDMQRLVAAIVAVSSKIPLLEGNHGGVPAKWSRKSSELRNRHLPAPMVRHDRFEWPCKNRCPLKLFALGISMRDFFSLKKQDLPRRSRRCVPASVHGSDCNLIRRSTSVLSTRLSRDVCLLSRRRARRADRGDQG